MHIKESNANTCNGKMIFQCKSIKMHVTVNDNYRSFFKLTFQIDFADVIGVVE